MIEAMSNDVRGGGGGGGGGGDDSGGGITKFPILRVKSIGGKVG